MPWRRAGRAWLGPDDGPSGGGPRARLWLCTSYLAGTWQALAHGPVTRPLAWVY